MDDINIRYGESLDLDFTVDDESAETAILYVGKAGETAVIVSDPVEINDGVGTFSLSSEDTKVPLDKYRYQVNIIHTDGKKEKYPQPDDCEDDCYPTFIVHEALDEDEVS